VTELVEVQLLVILRTEPHVAAFVEPHLEPTKSATNQNRT
jgi:hypothetical protein